MRFNEAKCSLGRSSNYTLLECNSGHIFLSNSNREVTESGPDASESPNLSLSPAGLGARLQRRVCRAFVHMVPACLPWIEMCADQLLSSKLQKPKSDGEENRFLSNSYRNSYSWSNSKVQRNLKIFFFAICPVPPPPPPPAAPSSHELLVILRLGLQPRT